MLRGPHVQRLGRGLLAAGRMAAVALVLTALLNVAAPHSHGSSVEERHCPACQVSRLDGTGLPERDAVAVLPPAGTEPANAAPAVDLAPREAHDPASASRGPPSSSPSEPS
mgnify:CR=1 FL=1